MEFLNDAWYVAGWSDEAKAGEMFHRTVLEQRIVFFRTADGRPVALRDRCPHRFVPLHLGKVKGDVVECCYHGLQFDCTGACVRNPHGDGHIPTAARVRSYPVVDRHGMLWIWMGESDHDPAAIPDYSMLDAGAGYRTSRGRTLIEANFELMGENLLDLSHVPFLHTGLLGSAEGLSAMPQVRTEGDRLHVDRWMPSVSVPGVFDMLFRRDGKMVDQWMNMRWDPPGCFLLDVGVHAPGESRERGAWYYGIHILTPETRRTTHYHYAAARPPGPELDPETNARLAEMRRIAFEDQDKPILAAQQEEIGDADFWSLKPALFAIDSGPVRMRRTLDRLREAERERGAARGCATAPSARPGAAQASGVAAVSARTPASPA